MKKFYSVVVMQLICIASISRLFAQSSDTISLKPVDVMGSRAAVFSGGVTTILSDSSKNSPFNNQTVSELLSANSSVFIKTYGSGGSATISSRGTEARHNAVLWNGFNINSSSLGLTDLSMIPAGLTDNITLLHGGSSPVNGNSAIGSTLVFENDFPQFKSFNNTTLVAEAGSYENIHGSIYSKWSTTYMESKTFLFYDGAKNNFNYTNFTHREQPDVTQKHASFSNAGIVQDFHFKIGKQQIISAGFWYQDTDRELPPLMTSPNNNATQRDSTWRMYLGYKMIYKKSILSLKGAYFREFQFYDDERLQYNYNYLVNNSFAEVEWRTVLNDKLILNSGISFNQGQASFEEYSGTQKRNTTALFSGLRYDFTKNW